MIFRLMAPLLVAVIFLSGCGGLAPKNAGMPRGVAGSTVADGVRVQASLDAYELDLTQPAEVHVTVTNEGSAKVTFLKYNGCDTGVQVALETNGQPVGWFRIVGPPVACTEALELGELAPGAKIEGRYSWVAATDAPLPGSGTYQVVVRFNRADDYEKVRPIATEVDVKVEGSPVSVGQEAAVTAAKADSRVDSWWKAHTGGAIVKQEEDQWYVLMARDANDATGHWEKATPAAAAATAGMVPEMATRYRDGSWEVRFFTKLGPAPREAIVLVDGPTGKVSSVRFE